MAYKSGAARPFTVAPRYPDGIANSTLSGNITLTTKSETWQRLDPGGSARDVTLPAEADSKGLGFYFRNAASGAENLVIKDDGGSTIVTLAQNAAGWVFCDGSAWLDFTDAA